MPNCSDGAVCRTCSRESNGRLARPGRARREPATVPAAHWSRHTSTANSVPGSNRRASSRPMPVCETSRTISGHCSLSPPCKLVSTCTQRPTRSMNRCAGPPFIALIIGFVLGQWRTVRRAGRHHAKELVTIRWSIPRLGIECREDRFVDAIAHRRHQERTVASFMASLLARIA